MSEDNKFIEGARRRRNRKWEPNIVRDFDDIVTSFDHQTVVSASRRLFQNNGYVKSVVETKSFYAIGSAFKPKYKGIDKEWKKLATDWLKKFYRVADVKGFDLNTFLYLVSSTIDIDGECFILLTTSKSGYPQVQAIPVQQIGQRSNDKIVSSGTYKGSKIAKGVIQQKNGRPIAYRVLGETPDLDQDISAASLIHVFESSYIGTQSRGLPLVTHCINAFKDLQQSQDLELTKSLLCASIAFIEHNETGDNGYGFDDDNVSGDPTCKTFDNIGGEIRYFESGSGGKLEFISNNNPSTEFQSYQDRLLTQALAGMGWPRQLVNLAGETGTFDRISLAVANKTIKDRQSLLMPIMERIITYALAVAIDLGYLPPNKDFTNWIFSTPSSISIDFGRDSKAILAEFAAGLRNRTSIFADEGLDFEETIRERYTEEALEILIKAEVESEYGVTIDPLKARLTSASEYSQPIIPNTDK